MATIKYKNSAGEWEELLMPLNYLGSTGGGEKVLLVDELWQGFTKCADAYLTIKTTGFNTISFDYDIDCGAIYSSGGNYKPGEYKRNIYLCPNTSVKPFKKATIDGVDYYNISEITGKDETRITVCKNILRVFDASYETDISNFDSITIVCDTDYNGQVDMSGYCHIHNIKLS